MCGIVAIQTSDDVDTALFKCLMDEAKIRGLHATGAAWAHGNRVHVDKQHVPENQFVWPDIPNTHAIIGHTRYTTSDGEDQPIVDAEFKSASALNGVITQEPHDQWKDQFGITCESENDAALILAANAAGLNPLECFNKSSQAVVQIDNNGTLYFWRNGQRPLYYVNVTREPDGLYMVLVASTKDILDRAIIKYNNANVSQISLVGPIHKCEPGMQYMAVPNHQFVITVPPPTPPEDWQP